MLIRQCSLCQKLTFLRFTAFLPELMYVNLVISISNTKRRLKENRRSYKSWFTLFCLCLHVITLVHCVRAEYEFSPKEYTERSNYSTPFMVFQHCHNNWVAWKTYNTHLVSCEITLSFSFILIVKLVILVGYANLVSSLVTSRVIWRTEALLLGLLMTTTIYNFLLTLF